MPETPEPASTATAPSTRRPVLTWLGLVAALAALAALGPAVLLWLAGFGQEPPDRLPVLAIMLLGAVFIGPFSDLLVGVAPKRRAPLLVTVALVGSLTGLALVGTGSGEWVYLLAPAVAVSGTWLLGRNSRRPGLYPAVTVYVAC